MKNYLYAYMRQWESCIVIHLEIKRRINTNLGNPFAKSNKYKLEVSEENLLIVLFNRSMVLDELFPH